MWSATSREKFCATCANWGGNRKLRSDSRSVEVEHCDSKGECYQRVGGSSNRSACSKCDKHSKWVALK